ncbi:protein phosphatase 1 regulatory subunit 17 isoform X2 [Lynx canadensis]|uniref:Protein phosphatase 1 regulatory subunit 17 n=3 Tax=Felinae TaxID=338152 RepID=A0ABI7WFK4_FELCA|nr:protein phosphatase 1 regulatory subunit 17 isoform X2 [Puma concolor]XP_030151134.1 protein phosphatase 1 regulatory subunit 17 isoform X2 [Lynx canadensis]XP_046951079.1 protein phosphatase 1 regulatory subunit 17 isoform X2 [Lynx rufus]
MMSTEQMQPLELSEDRLDKLDPHREHLGVLSEHFIQRYDVQERHPKGKMSPAVHNTDLEQKKPRRKDTPALHVSPFAAGMTLLRDERPKVIMEDDEKDGDKIAI